MDPGNKFGMKEEHKAYEKNCIIQKLPSNFLVEAISAYEDQIFLTGKSGTLLVYKVVAKENGELENGFPPYDAELLKHIDAFSKKPITQIQIVPEFQMMICLTGGLIVVYDLNDISSKRPIATLHEVKGAHYFSADVQKLKSLTEETKLLFRLCVAVKKKLQLFYWNSRKCEFLVFNEDSNLKDIPRTIVWCGESLCVGYKSEYSLVKISGDLKDLFPTGGKQLEPLVTLLPNNLLALGNDEQTFLIDSEGNPTLKYSIEWSEVPIALVYDEPYLIAVLPTSVEVRSIEPRMHVQTIDLKAKMIVKSKSGWIFAASGSEVWFLHAVNYSAQVSHLIEQKRYKLALSIVEMTDKLGAEKEQEIHNIENLYAFHLICIQDFKEAMKKFSKLKTDPLHVIGMFPNLLPVQCQSSLKYPDTLPYFIETDLEEGLSALLDYLVELRGQLIYNKEFERPSRPIMESGAPIQLLTNEQLLQIIDTTLLKCYLQVNKALVASLLRLKDFHCHLDESESLLKQHSMYNELIILYNNNGIHRKALELLERHVKKDNSPLKGYESIISYLQQLGHEHMDLVFEFAKPVLLEHPQMGLRIFIKEIENENLPCLEVVSYLEKIKPDLLIPYLEVIIHDRKEENPLFYLTLMNKYEEIITRLKTAHRDLLLGKHPFASEELKELRTKLLQLRTSFRFGDGQMK